MPIYMVTTVAHPAQALVRTEAFRMIGGYDMEVEHMNADRSLWFYLSYFYDAAYIRKKMSNIRIGEQTETIITQKNMQHPILCHLTIKDYVKFAKAHDLIPVYEREREALKRLAEEFVGYCAGMIYVGDFETAKIYLDYAKLVDREIDRSDRYQRLQKMFSGNVDFAYIKEISQNHYQHKRSYEPPKGYIEIEIEEET